MGKCLFMRKGETHSAPKVGIELSTIAEGSIVKINENGTPVEFYVAKHNYESSLNGTGRTLLVRKDCYDLRAWDSSNVNAYATSSIDTWLNQDYKSMLETTVQTGIGQTQFYYTVGNNSSTVTTISRSIFLLSLTELGGSGNNINVEGSTLPIVSKLNIAYMNGSASDQWTRSPIASLNTSNAVYIDSVGNREMNYCKTQYGSRPCFTLSSEAKFDESTLILKGVA